MLPAATGAELGAFLKANVELSRTSDRRARGLSRRDAALGNTSDTPPDQDQGAIAGAFFPIIHTLFSNISLAPRHPSRCSAKLPLPAEWSTGSIAGTCLMV